MGGVFGPIIPPSILMVLYAVASGASVGDMLLAGLLPGLFLGLVLIVVVVMQCIKKGYKSTGPRILCGEIWEFLFCTVRTFPT